MLVQSRDGDLYGFECEIENLTGMEQDILVRSGASFVAANNGVKFTTYTLSTDDAEDNLRAEFRNALGYSICSNYRYSIVPIMIDRPNLPVTKVQTVYSIFDCDTGETIAVTPDRATAQLILDKSLIRLDWHVVPYYTDTTDYIIARKKEVRDRVLATLTNEEKEALGIVP